MVIHVQDTMRKSEELSLLKSAFLSNMSHDVRTPLARIIGLVDVLVEECQGEQLEFAEMIRDSGDRLPIASNGTVAASSNPVRAS